MKNEKPKFTPGPWTVYKLSGMAYSIRATHLNPKIVGNCDREANAALIAAAPDLLAALEKLEAAMDYYLSPAFESAYDIKLPARMGEFNAIMEARAAIAKAKGE